MAEIEKVASESPAMLEAVHPATPPTTGKRSKEFSPDEMDSAFEHFDSGSTFPKAQRLDHTSSRNVPHKFPKPPELGAYIPHCACLPRTRIHQCFASVAGNSRPLSFFMGDMGSPSGVEYCSHELQEFPAS